MPFRRRNNRSRFRRRRRRRPVRRRGRRRMSRRLDPERKDVVENQGTILLNTGGLRTILNGVPSGVDPGNRIGRQAMFLSITGQFKFLFGTGAVVPQNVRMWLVHDSQPDGVLLTLGDLLGDVTAPTVSLRNMDKTRKLRVLWTRKFCLDVFRPCRTVTMNRKFRIISRYNGPGAGVAPLISGALVMVIVADTLAGPIDPTVQYQTRTRFVG